MSGGAPVTAGRPSKYTVTEAAPAEAQYSVAASPQTAGSFPLIVGMPSSGTVRLNVAIHMLAPLLASKTSSQNVVVLISGGGVTDPLPPESTGNRADFHTAERTWYR